MNNKKLNRFAYLLAAQLIDQNQIMRWKTLYTDMVELYAQYDIDMIRCGSMVMVAIYGYCIVAQNIDLI